MFKKFQILSIFLIALIYSCTSPVDIDTSRKVKAVNVPHVVPECTQVDFEQNGVQNSLSLLGVYSELDTSGTVPVLWLYMSVVSKPSASNNNDRINLGQLEFKLDSIPLNGIPVSLNSLLKSNAWAKFSLSRGLNTKSDTTMTIGADRNVFEISFDYNKIKSEITSVFNSKIYDYKVWIERSDTVIRDSVKVLRFDTTWVDNKMKIKEYWTYEVKEVKLTIENEKRCKDSLTLNGKFLLKF